MKRRPKILLFLFLILLFLGGFFGFEENILAASSTIIINEIQTAGSSANDEWIELYNPTDTIIDISNWSIQYRGGSGANYYKKNFEDGDIIPAKHFFLIAHGGAGNYAGTTTPDMSWSQSFSSTGGTIFLVNNQSLLVDGTSAFVVDKVSYGVGIYLVFEVLPAIRPGSNQSIERKNFQDTNNNHADFDLLNTPTPHNGLFTEDTSEEEEKILCAGNPTDIKINEIYPNTEDEDDEFVEIINTGADCVDISSWAIKDATTISSHKTIFPDNTILKSGEFFYIEKNLYLNNDADTVYLSDETGTEKDQREYTEAVRDKSYSFDGTDWLWTSLPTKGAKNQFDPVEDTSDTTTDTSAEDTSLDYNVYLNEILPNPKGDEKSGEFIEIYNADDLEANLSGWTLKDSSATKYVFPAGTKIAAKQYLAIYRTTFKFTLNNSGPETVYLLDKDGDTISSVSYDDDAKEDASYSLDGTTWRWNNILTPGKENEFEKKLKVSIVKIKANPKGKDVDGEEIYLKNNSKKKVNLKNWSLATGSETLYNHPITKDFVINPGKTKKITRKYSLFTLNNKKGAIELRYPNGEVASRVKYDKKKESVKDDEVYELSEKKWQWSAPPEETAEAGNNPQENSLTPSENPGDINPENEPEISDEEITLNLGKYSSENKLALVETGFIPAPKNPLQGRETPGIVLGAFSVRNENHKPIEIKSATSWDKTLQKSNQLFNLLINQILSLI